METLLVLFLLYVFIGGGGRGWSGRKGWNRESMGRKRGPRRPSTRYFMFGPNDWMNKND